MRRLVGLAAAVAVLAAGCGAGSAVERVSARQSAPVGPAATLDLRLVTSYRDLDDGCDAPPLTTPGPGAVCSSDQSTRYSVGPSLLNFSPRAASMHRIDGADDLIVTLDGADAGRLAALTQPTGDLGYVVLFHGEAVSELAPTVLRDAGTLDLFVGGDGDTDAALEDAVHATGPSEPPSSSSSDQAAAACARLGPRVAPGLRFDRVRLDGWLTAGRLARALSARGEGPLEQGTFVATWRAEPPDEPVFTCTYRRVSAPTPSAWCSGGMVAGTDDSLPVRSFYADRRGTPTATFALEDFETTLKGLCSEATQSPQG